MPKRRNNFEATIKRKHFVLPTGFVEKTYQLTKCILCIFEFFEFPRKALEEPRKLIKRTVEGRD